jgi:hypothetical protein
MSDKEKIVEVISNNNGIRLNDIWGDSGVFIETVGTILDELIKEEKIEIRRTGIMEYYYLL